MGKLLAASILLLVLIVGGVIGYEKYQDYQLDKWARSVKLSEAQQEAMWEIWTLYKKGKSTRISPLKKLTKSEVKYLTELSIPSELARKQKFSYNKFKSLKAMGFDVDERAIIMAMEINHVGRKDLFGKD